MVPDYKAEILIFTSFSRHFNFLSCMPILDAKLSESDFNHFEQQNIGNMIYVSALN